MKEWNLQSQRQYTRGCSHVLPSCQLLCLPGSIGLAAMQSRPRVLGAPNARLLLCHRALFVWRSGSPWGDQFRQVLLFVGLKLGGGMCAGGGGDGTGPNSASRRVELATETTTPSSQAAVWGLRSGFGNLMLFKNRRKKSGKCPRNASFGGQPLFAFPYLWRMDRHAEGNSAVPRNPLRIAIHTSSDTEQPIARQSPALPQSGSF